MDEPALRDLDRWKEKIEVRLDNRQVFFLFFGSALVACMLFVLGVVVGKRLEARGRAETPKVEDPLALLDKVASSQAAKGDDGLTFERALGTPAAVVTKPAAAKTKSDVGAPLAAPATATPKTSVVADPPLAESKTAAPSPLPVAAKTKSDVGAVLAPPAPKSPSPVTAKSSAPVPSPIAAKTDAPAVEKLAVSLRSSPVPTQDPVEAAKNKGRWTLQVSSFPTRAEADAFAKRFSGQGVYILPSELPGKGLWYRVRVGDYASAKEATDAKAAFEHKNSVIAYVAGR